MNYLPCSALAFLTLGLGHFTVEADFGILIVNDMLSVLLKVQSLISAVLSIFVACDSPVHSFLARLDEVQEELLYYPWDQRRH